ncbi:MAG TPA: hypothetical protein PLB89_00680 [Flavobacteriales bacterium]|nr:hypothetical protein [Flavobacteriales bacterium]
MGRLLVCFCCMVACGSLVAQQDSLALPYPRGHVGHFYRDEITLLAGFNQGRYGFAELGVGRSAYGVVHHPLGVGYFAGAELRPDRPELIGWKLGGYITFGGEMGLQLIRYQEGAAGSTVIRPELGIGIWKARLAYAYNINLSPSRIDGINTHMVSMSYALRMFTLSARDDRFPK